MSFGASGFWVATVGEVAVFALVAGSATALGEKFAPVAKIVPPTSTANLLAIPVRNVFLSLGTRIPLSIQQIQSALNCKLRVGRSTFIFLPDTAS